MTPNIRPLKDNELNERVSTLDDYTTLFEFIKINQPKLVVMRAPVVGCVIRTQNPKPEMCRHKRTKPKCAIVLRCV